MVVEIQIITIKPNGSVWQERSRILAGSCGAAVRIASRHLVLSTETIARLVRERGEYTAFEGNTIVRIAADRSDKFVPGVGPISEGWL